jgi:transcription initiation factor TFIIIB Brf1 subunit/transcription initiation factor TFIIB
MAAGTAAEAELIRRLDTVIALLRIGFRTELTRVRDELMSDSVGRGIIEATEDWIGARELTKKVAEVTGRAERTIRDRIGELVALGVVQSEGATWTRRYRSTGLI